MADAVSRYPKARPPFFAMRYIRLLTKTAAAQQIGADAFALCCVVAATEDVKRYTGPVTFFNEQIIPLIGAATWRRLDRARTEAVEAGWLAYVPNESGKRKPGTYWATIPEGAAAFPDGPIDENPDPIGDAYRRGYADGKAGRPYVESAEPPTDGASQRCADSTEPSAERTGRPYAVSADPTAEPIAEGSAEPTADLSYLSLSLTQQEKRPRFKRPTVEEVREYIEERGSKIDPEQFHDHYEANGWVQGKGGKPIRDWKAAARTWERNGVSRPASSAARPQPAEPMPKEAAFTRTAG